MSGFVARAIFCALSTVEGAFLDDFIYFHNCIFINISMSIYESSPDTIKGSFSDDLVLSKFWLCKQLIELDLVKFDTIYILGSWYANMSLFLVDRHFEFDHCYNIDWDREKTAQASHILKRMQLSDKIRAVQADVNSVKFTGDRILVINTSTNDISGRDWLDHIPSGAVVALQGKDHQEDSNGIDTYDKFVRAYPLAKTLFEGFLTLEDVRGDPYQRFMKIGRK